jgi:hypothetical protein
VPAGISNQGNSLPVAVFAIHSPSACPMIPGGFFLYFPANHSLRRHSAGITILVPLLNKEIVFMTEINPASAKSIKFALLMVFLVVFINLLGFGIVLPSLAN